MRNRIGKNWGLLFDSCLATEEQVNLISKPDYYHIHNIGSIRRYIIRDCSKTLAQAIKTPRLDYSNALPYGFPGILMVHLQ